MMLTPPSEAKERKTAEPVRGVYVGHDVEAPTDGVIQEVEMFSSAAAGRARDYDRLVASDIRYRSESVDEFVARSGRDWTPDAVSSFREQVADRSELPEVPTGQRRAALTDATARVIEGANSGPSLFRRGRAVTQIVRDERGLPEAIEVTPVALGEHLARIARWTKETKDGPPVEQQNPPGSLPSWMLETPALSLPALHAITEHPVLTPDGRLRTQRGYDPGSGTYFAPSVPIGELAPVDRAGPDAVAVAKDWMSELFAGVGFADAASRVHALAFMLTPIVRPLIDGPLPMWAVSASRVGVGKSTLVRAIWLVLTGREPVSTSLKADEDENQKAISAVLRGSPAVVFLDNWPEGTLLDSAILEQLLTERAYQARIIQTSKAPRLEIRNSWAITGNNLRMNEAIARRAYWTEIVSDLERPADRADWPHPDILDWTRRNRIYLLEAALSLVCAWANDGMKITPGPKLGSYEAWSSIVGSVLRHAGIRGFLTNEQAKRDRAEDDRPFQFAALLAAIETRLGSDPFTLRDVVDAAGGGGDPDTWQTPPDAELAAAIEPFVDITRNRPGVALAKVIGPFLDGWYGDRRIRKLSKDRLNTIRYEVVAR